MYVPFSQLPATARVWIYQASRPLTPAELEKASPLLERFADDWTSHGRTLHAAAEFRHQQFLVIGLDEAVAGASGCSIDASVRFVQQLEAWLGVALLEKSRLAFQYDGEVRLLDHKRLRETIASGEINKDTIFFDNTLLVKAELDDKWPAPAGRTWLARYFSQVEKPA
jgi:hypothetical protein